jgi:hypothetical protein
MSHVLFSIKKKDETTKFNSHMYHEPWLRQTWFYIKKMDETRIKKLNMNEYVTRLIDAM